MLTKDEIIKAQEEYKALQVILKEAGALPKEPKKLKRADNENHIAIVAGFSPHIENFKPKIRTLFDLTKNDKKPEGQEWLIFKLEGDYSFALLSNNAAIEKEKRKAQEETDKKVAEAAARVEADKEKAQDERVLEDMREREGDTGLHTES